MIEKVHINTPFPFDSIKKILEKHGRVYQIQDEIVVEVHDSHDAVDEITKILELEYVYAYIYKP